MPEIPGVLHAEIRLHPDVQSLDEEWSGITNPAVRRKLQNRLNQRAARRRKASQKAESQRQTTPSSSSDSTALTVHSDRTVAPRRINLRDLIALKTKKASATDWQTAAASFKPTFGSAFLSLRSKDSCQRWYELLLQNRLVEIKDLAGKLQDDRDTAWLYPLPKDHLISLVYYNVYRAFISNVNLLGLDLNLMYADEYPSPFLPLSQTANSNIRQLPPSLQPTELQRTIAHHPQWDIFPDPCMRDNILRYGEENIDDLELCLDMVGDGKCETTEDLDSQTSNGMIVWGEPWQHDAWEVTEKFARKWPFILRGAIEAQRATDKWRALRNLEPLDWDRILEIE